MVTCKHQTCIKSSPFGQREGGLLRQLNSLKRFHLYDLFMTGQEQGYLLMQVNAK